MKENDIIVTIPINVKGKPRKKLINKINKKSVLEGFVPFNLESHILWISDNIETLVFHRKGRASYCCHECGTCDILCINRSCRKVSFDEFMNSKD
jgi:hypothetical protein